MGERIWRILVIVLLQISITRCQNNDRAVLLALKSAWNNIPPSWKEGSDHCGGGWEGISCTKFHVTEISLSSMGLTGVLSSDIGQLAELQILVLSYNTGLTGSLPPAIGNLRKLTDLWLVGCSFSGLIPDTIGNLLKLTNLALNNNSFSGPIPASIGNLNKLYWLDLSTNLLDGSIPVSNGMTPGLDMLISTKHFHLGDNQLSGNIPSQLFNSKMSLFHLLLNNNNLTGSIPSTLGLVKSLGAVRLDRNHLSGNVPKNINNLTNMTEMHLSNNQLNGPVPNLTGMSYLSYVDMSNNSFDESDVPPWFSTLQSLTTLKMHRTKIGGEPPDALFSLPSLQIVDLSDNRLNGTFDLSSNPTQNLQVVDLRMNQIDKFTQGSQYSADIMLFDNPVCTAVTDKYCSLATNNNSVSSNIPYSTPQNNCEPSSCGSGLVSSPNCLCAYPYTGMLIFKAPSFSWLGNSTMYTILHDSLMSVFKGLPVDSVLLSDPSINLGNYLVIILEIFPSGVQSFNRTGILEVGFVLSSQKFDPTKAFNTYVFYPEDYHNFLSETGGTQKNSSNTGIVIGSSVAGCVLVVLLLLAGIYAYRQKGRAERATQESRPFAHWDTSSGSGGVPQLKGPRSFTFEELNKYTNNFSEINKIGAGGYGMVYKASLPNGQLIAIKRAQHASTQGKLEFKTEIELLSRVHHKNLVELVGFCFDQDEQMLVYEYIVNGSLKDCLSGRSGIRLDWTRRLKIALGAARGLQYLHDLADPPIIHRDVKTSNILLDARLVAKVADFGLSKPLGDANRTHVTTEVKGTMGYLDPEYYMTQQLTEKSDVYSFGVVMLELITARNPIEKGKYIVREIKQSMNKSKELYDLHEVLDPTIGLSSQVKGLERFVDLSLRCVEETGNQRPSMSEVVKELESIMDFIGLKHESSSSTSESYEGTARDYSHPYSNDSLFAYSRGLLPPKLQP